MFLNTLPDEIFLHFKMTLDIHNFNYWFKYVDGYVTVIPSCAYTINNEFLEYNGVYYAGVKDAGDGSFIYGEDCGTRLHKIADIMEWSADDIEVRMDNECIHLLIKGVDYVL